MEERGWDVAYRRRVSVSRGLLVVNGDALRERNLLEATETGFLSSFFSVKPCLKWRAATSDLNL